MRNPRYPDREHMAVITQDGMALSSIGTQSQAALAIPRL
jgi:hypothetical protein